MKLGILQCDDVPDPLGTQFKNYPEMFAESFRGIVSNLCLTTFRIHEDQFPESTDQCLCWLITGSRYSSYDDRPWMRTLEGFIRQLYHEGRKLLGVCFGHQIIASALGGTVALSEKGWGVGMSVNQIISQQSWMNPAINEFRLLVSHQDQVTVLPKQTKVLASSSFCPYFLLQYGQHFLGVQGHPEFTRNYSSALMNLRKGRGIPEDIVANGLASLVDEDDSKLMNVWIVNFLNSV